MRWKGVQGLPSPRCDHLRIEDYMEKSAGDLNLKVDRQRYGPIRAGREMGYNANGSYEAFLSGAAVIRPERP